MPVSLRRLAISCRRNFNSVFPCFRHTRVMPTEEFNDHSAGPEFSNAEKPDPEGIDFFPERRGDKISRSWFRILLFGEGRDNLEKVRCERNVHNCVAESKFEKKKTGFVVNNSLQVMQGCQIN